MLRALTPVLMVIALGAAAPQTKTGGAATKQELVRLYRKYAAARDTAGIHRLVYWRGVQSRERAAFDRSLAQDFKFDVAKVAIEPLPRDRTVEYTLEGVTYRPNLKPVADLVVTYKPRGKLTGYWTRYLVGTTGGRYYITLASPVRPYR